MDTLSTAERQALQWGRISKQKEVMPVFMVSTNDLQQVELFTCFSDLSVLIPILEKSIQMIKENEKRTKIGQ